MTACTCGVKLVDGALERPHHTSCPCAASQRPAAATPVPGRQLPFRNKRRRRRQARGRKGMMS